MLKGFASNYFVDLGQFLLAEALAEVNEQRRIKRLFVPVCLIAEKVLQIGIFPDLLHSLLVAGNQALFDDQRPECDSYRFGRRPQVGVVKAFTVGFFKVIPRDKLGQFHPAIVSIEMSLKGPVKGS